MAKQNNTSVKKSKNDDRPELVAGLEPVDQGFEAVSSHKAVRLVAAVMVVVLMLHVVPMQFPHPPTHSPPRSLPPPPVTCSYARGPGTGRGAWLFLGEGVVNEASGM